MDGFSGGEVATSTSVTYPITPAHSSFMKSLFITSHCSIVHFTTESLAETSPAPRHAFSPASLISMNRALQMNLFDPATFAMPFSSGHSMTGTIASSVQTPPNISFLNLPKQLAPLTKLATNSPFQLKTCTVCSPDSSFKAPHLLKSPRKLLTKMEMLEAELSDLQKYKLNRIFEKSMVLSHKQLQQISSTVGLTKRQIRTWIKEKRRLDLLDIEKRVSGASKQASFPSNKSYPSIPKYKKAYLLQRYANNPYIDDDECKALGGKLGLNPNKVSNWFQSRTLELRHHEGRC